MMNTNAIANKLVEMCRAGQVDEVKELLFADDINIEPREGLLPKITKGMNGIRKKATLFASVVENFYGNAISEPVVAGNFFSVSWDTYLQMKGETRTTNSELCVYEVKDGKIISEQFFY